MIRASLVLSIALLGTIHAAAADSLPLELKGEVSISQDVIHVGDLWDNAGDKAGMAIAQAPQPGKRVTLNSRWLSNLASSNGLDWHPASQFDHTVVERVGQTIDVNVVETELREALNLEGVPSTSTFEINNRQALAIVLPADASPTIAIKNLILDRRTHRFSATVETPAGSPAATQIKITGRTFATTRLPVLNRTVNLGDTITAQDIIWTDMRDENLRQDLLVDPARIIGMEPRVLLKSNTPIRAADLQRPMAVTRNSQVTMLLQTPYMKLSTQGRAMDDAAIGDTVRVTNLQTKQIIEGRVQSPGIVAITATSALTSSKPQTAAAY